MKNFTTSKNRLYAYIGASIQHYSNITTTTPPTTYTTIKDQYEASDFVIYTSVVEHSERNAPSTIVKKLRLDTALLDL